jgi:hypothetical protein
LWRICQEIQTSAKKSLCRSSALNIVTRLTGLVSFGREAAFYPAREAGGAVFGLKGLLCGALVVG